MITVCCFLWFDPKGKCNSVYVYGPEHVRILRNMFARHLTVPHEFVCITDQPEVFDGEFRTVDLDKSKHVPGTRYAKLMLFRPDAKELLGERILYCDLDAAAVANLDSLVQRDEELVLWRNPNFGINKTRAFYNTSLILLKAGARPELWSEFDPKRTPSTMPPYPGGTDQKWISLRASREEAHWSGEDGVYGTWRNGDVIPGVTKELPDNARLVFFPGRREPGMAEVQETFPWLKEHYR